MTNKQINHGLVIKLNELGLLHCISELCLCNIFISYICNTYNSYCNYMCKYFSLDCPVNVSLPEVGQPPAAGIGWASGAEERLTVHHTHYKQTSILLFYFSS